MASTNSENVNLLMEMGFSKEQAEKADAATSGNGLQAAIEWLMQHPEGSDSQTMGTSSVEFQDNNAESEKTGDGPTETSGSNNDAQPPQQALSLVCEECGKQLRSELDAQAHAARSGHQKFAESSEEVKPLTEEEKQQQIEILQKRLLERRKQREESEKEQEKKREMIRRKSGKQITDAKQKHEQSEIKRIAEERRREKQEDKLYRQKLKQKIAQDRANMKAQQSTSKSVPAPSQAVIATPEVKKQETREYDTCRIQLRFPNGSVSTGNFKPTDVLSTICEYAASNGYDGDSPMQLMTTFPRKTFSSAEMDKTLKDLGLVPSSVIIVTKT